MKLANLSTPNQTEDVALLVDPEATLSWIPRKILERLNATASPVYRLNWRMAVNSDAILQRSYLTIDGRKAPVAVAFGEEGEDCFGRDGNREFGTIARPD